MGLDATIFVLARHSNHGVGYVTHTFQLRQDSDLWPHLEAVASQAERKWPHIQLPQGALSNCLGDAPKDWQDRERGHLQSDAYGNPFKSFPGAHLEELARAYPGWRTDDLNRATFEFIATHLADHQAIIFWH